MARTSALIERLKARRDELSIAIRVLEEELAPAIEAEGKSNLGKAMALLHRHNKTQTSSGGRRLITAEVLTECKGSPKTVAQIASSLRLTHDQVSRALSVAKREKQVKHVGKTWQAIN